MMNWLTKYDFFVAYSHQQSEWVIRFVASMRKLKYRVFVDADIPPGDDWKRTINEAIDRSRVGVIVASDASMVSAEVCRELELLLNKNQLARMRLVHVRLGNVAVPAMLDKFQAIILPDESEASCDEAVRQVVERLPRRWRWSLRGLAAASFATVMIPTGFAITTESTRVHYQDAMRALQERVQGYDEVVRTLGPNVPYDGDGDVDYVDPSTGQRVATDRWESGRLVFRYFYEGTRLIARDTFTLDSHGAIVEKTREYVGPKRIPILMDHFTPGGALRQKCRPVEGDSGRCEKLVDDMRSPLPPVWIMPYR